MIIHVPQIKRVNLYVASYCWSYIHCTIILYSWKFCQEKNFAKIATCSHCRKLFFCVKDCIVDMVTSTALAKTLSLENYYNTNIHICNWLGENFIPQNFRLYRIKALVHGCKLYVACRNIIDLRWSYQ